MRTVVLFVLVIICCSQANGQKSTPADPFGLAEFGFEKKLESRPLIVPSEAPPQSQACGTGVYLREETVTVKNKAKKVKAVIVHFLPNPSTLSAFADSMGKMKPDPAPDAGQMPTNLPPGVSSLTFFWPTEHRRVQGVLMMRVEKVNDRLMERALNFPAQLVVQEGNSPAILWNFDHYVPGSPPPMLLGNMVMSDPVILRISLPRGAKKCIEGK